MKRQVDGTLPMTRRIYDVAIIGCGPAGAVAANLFGRSGFKTLVIEHAHDIYDKPRAVALDHEIARVLQGLGMAEAIAPHIAPFTASEYYGIGGRLIRRLDMLPPPHPQAWTPSMVFMQPAIEALLRQNLAKYPTVDVWLDETLVSLAQSDEAVNLQLRNADGRTSDVTARFVIGCDGASSTVRRELGITFDDLGFDEPWLVVDVLANEKGLAKLPLTSVQYCEPERPTTFVMCTGGHRRWEMMLLPDEDPRHMEQPEQVWRLLNRWITPDDATLWRSTSYRFHALVAQRWRKGRVFLAGDAAHQQPPFLGQGLCQGIRDVVNLAWKLGRVLRGRSHADLLDSYEVERSAHVRKLTSIIKGIGGVIGERDHKRAIARDARLIEEAGGTVHSMPRQDLMPGLEKGILDPSCYPTAGTLFPQPWIIAQDGRRRLDDVAGADFKVVLSEAYDADTRDLVRHCAAEGLHVFRITQNAVAPSHALQNFVEADSVVAQWFRRHGSIAAIVRPDNYVFAATKSTAELAAQINDLAALLR